jgi:hypothetical protein
MADIAIDNVAHKPERRAPFLAVYLPPLVLFALVIMASDFTWISLAPLKALHIPYLKAIDYAHLAIPGFCAVIWLATLRKWPTAGSTLAVALCVVLVAQIPGYAERRTARVPVRRSLESEEQKSFERRNGFPVYQTGSKEGMFVVVAPEHEVQARDDLSRLGLVSSERPGG